jgi:hypothetical protein
MFQFAIKAAHNRTAPNGTPKMAMAIRATIAVKIQFSTDIS